MAFDNFVARQVDFFSKTQRQSYVFQSESEKSVTYGELGEQIKTLSQIFLSHGLSCVSPVLVSLPRSAVQCVYLTSLLCHEIPALVLPLESGVGEVIRVLQQFPFGGLITSEAIFRKIQAFLSHQDFVAMQTCSSSENGSIVLCVRKTKHQDESLFSWLLHTSGSTGVAKAVMLSSENIFRRTLGETELFQIKNQSRLLNLLPFSHDLGLNQLLTTIYTGSSLEIFTKRLPLELANKLRHDQFDGITGVPMIWNSLIKVINKLKIEMLGHGYLSISGGSMTEFGLGQLKAIFKNQRIYKTYGQTETFRTLAETDQAKVVSKSCGQKLKGVDYLLFDENFSACREGDVGQLFHYGEGVMSGYWQDPMQSMLKMQAVKTYDKSQPPSKVGILTGDYFKVLPGNELEFVGRTDDMIKRNGWRFYLSEVEDVIAKLNFVENVCVLRAEDHGDEFDREWLVAFVVIKAERSEKLQGVSRLITEHCLSHLPAYKAPNEVQCLSELPLTISNKIDRKQLLSYYLKSKIEG